jgi:hypothetical protein
MIEENCNVIIYWLFQIKLADGSGPDKGPLTESHWYMGPTMASVTLTQWFHV